MGDTITKWPMLDPTAREIIMQQVKDRGYCSFGGPANDIYVMYPSGSVRTIVVFVTEDERHQAWDQVKDFESICIRNRGNIIQALIDGFENWKPE